MKIKEELIDRCGPLPAPAVLLLDTAALRLIAKEKGISEVHEEPEGILMYFRSSFKLPEGTFQRFVSAPQTEVQLIPGTPPGVRVFFKPEENGLDALGRFLRWAFAK